MSWTQQSLMLSVASVAKHMITWSMIAPFPEEYVEKSQKTQKGKNFRTSAHDTQKFYHQEQEICNKWQQDRCQVPSCKRAHVCRGCRGSEPHNRCKQCNKQ